MRNREEARKEAEALVSRMTTEEKAGQLKYNAPAIPRLGIPASAARRGQGRDGHGLPAGHRHGGDL